jgi:gas vesicle protein
MEAGMKKFGNFLFGAMLGGLIGSGLALLFAPASGKQTQQEIVNYFDHLKDEVQRAADEKRDELETQLHALQSGKQVTIEEKEA